MEQEDTQGLNSSCICLPALPSLEHKFREKVSEASKVLTRVKNVLAEPGIESGLGRFLFLTSRNPGHKGAGTWRVPVPAGPSSPLITGGARQAGSRAIRIQLPTYGAGTHLCHRAECPGQAPLGGVSPGRGCGGPARSVPRLRAQPPPRPPRGVPCTCPCWARRVPKNTQLQAREEGPCSGDLSCPLPPARPHVEPALCGLSSPGTLPGPGGPLAGLSPGPACGASAYPCASRGTVPGTAQSGHGTWEARAPPQLVKVSRVSQTEVLPDPPGFPPLFFLFSDNGTPQALRGPGPCTPRSSPRRARPLLRQMCTREQQRLPTRLALTRRSQAGPTCPHVP